MRTAIAVTVHAHFDGKVIVPDQPLDLPAGQAVVVQIQPVGGERIPEQPSVLSWLAANAVDAAEVPEDLAERHDHHLYGAAPADER